MFMVLGVAVGVGACAPATRSSSFALAPGLAEPRSATLVEELAAHDFARAERQFDDPLRAAIPEAALRSAWARVEHDIGAPISIEADRTFTRNGALVEVTTLRCQHGLADVRVTWTRAGTVTALSVRPGDVAARAIAVARAALGGDAATLHAAFSPKMQSVLSAERLGRLLDELRATLGSLQGVEDVSVRAGPFDVAAVECRLDRGRLIVRVAFELDRGPIEALYFAPPKQDPDPGLPAYADRTKFVERDVRIGLGNRALPGTLTLPKSAANAPAVVLVAGSGPQDRDESNDGHRPFRDLATGLATRGIAVLRYEKRTFGRNALTIADPATLTIDEEAVDDAVVAVTLLASEPAVDRHRVFVVGHSLGGTIAPLIAERAPVSGLVILAGAARPLEDVILDQETALLGTEPSHAAELDRARREVALVKSDELEGARPEELPLGIPASYWSSLRGYQPAERAQALHRPLLALRAAEDVQATAADFEIWRTALAAEPNATFRTFAGLDHFFSEPRTDDRPDHVRADVVDAIASWVAAH
jgi:hypothetical protein